MDGLTEKVQALERPDRALLVYNALVSLLLGPLFLLYLVPKWLRFRTLRYRFDDQGVTMRWGVLFRREISLTYSRIQDIHLASNVTERYLGLARILVQTASGSSGAEMTIEGLREFEAVRDFLYSRMRGARTPTATSHTTAVRVDAPSNLPMVKPEPHGTERLAELLDQVASELEQLRATLVQQREKDL